MALDPQARQFIQRLAEKSGPPLAELGPDDVRRALASNPTGTPEPVAATEARAIPGPHGDIPVRIYRPTRASALPALVYFHGGGWVAGNLDSAEAACTRLANRAGAVVMSVDYRLAPEHKFPAAVDDCQAATQWVAEHAETLDIDAARIAVGGDSAGGNLAAVVSLLARDAGGPAIVAQLLFYPAMQHAFDTVSHRENGRDYYLTTELMTWFWNHYLNDESEGRDVRASPLLAHDASGLPPALVVTAEFDPLRDEGEAYAARLDAAGTPATLRRYDGQIHSFVTRPGVMDAGARAIDESAAYLRDIFDRTAVT